jgi:hypothetical protein
LYRFGTTTCCKERAEKFIRVRARKAETDDQRFTVGASCVPLFWGNRWALRRPRSLANLRVGRACQYSSRNLWEVSHVLAEPLLRGRPLASRQEVRESGCTWARLVRVPAHAGSHSWGPKPNPVSASVGVARNPGGHALPTGTQANQAGLLNWLIRQTVAGGHERSIAAHKPDASRSTGTGTQDRTFSQAK